MTGAADKLPLVSIFCVCKDGHQTIRRCVESVLKQDYPNIEFVVQDGASTDGTLEILRGYNEVNAKIKLVSEPDSGPAAGFFRGLNRCSGEIIGSCLSDEELLPHAVSWAVNNFAKLPDVAAIYGDCHITDWEGNITKQYLAPEFDIKRFLCREIYPPFSASFFRRVCLDEVGLKDKKWALDCGEAEIWTRLGLKLPIRHVKGIVTKYAWHAAQSSKSIKNLNNVLIPGTIRLMNRIFQDPGTPDDIRSIREEAFAGFHLWLVQEFLASNAVSDAIKQFEMAFQYKPREKRVNYIGGLLLQQGTTFLQQGQAAQALSCFDALLSANLTSPNLHGLRAAAFSNLDESDGAKIRVNRIEDIKHGDIGPPMVIQKSEDTETQKKAKYLSFVVPARQISEDELWLHRMQTFIDRLIYQCKKYEVASEIIVVDWNAPKPGKKLSKLIALPDSLGPVDIRFIEVPPHVHNKIPNSDKLSFFQYIADNVGIRRAIGEYILVTAIDVLFTDEMICFFADKQLDPNCFYRIDRYDLGIDRIPADISNEKQAAFCSQHIVRVNRCNGSDEGHVSTRKNSTVKPDNDYWEKSYQEINVLLEKGKGLPPHTNASGDFLLMKREKWHTLRGYPELPRGQLFLDGILVYMAYVSDISQVVVPDTMKMFHIKHATSWLSHQDLEKKPLSLDYQKEYIPWCQKMLREKRPLNPNDENWGLAQYKLKEFMVSGSVARTEMRGEIEGDTDTSDTFHEWITKLELTQNRLYYRDQSPESLKYLLKLVVKYKPTKIVELGTLSGLSLRTWLLADSEAEIIAIDMSMAPLRQSQQIIPVDLSKVKLIEKDILKTDLSRLWGPDDRVLLYIDAHDMPNVPIMDYVLQNAVPALPADSMVVVDDLWHSSTILEDKSARQFFENTVINDIDPLQCFQGYYAPYWKGGSFFGFREVIPLMQWVNRNKVKLIVPTGIKSIAFQPPDRTRYTSEYDSKKFSEFAGRIRYNPIETICGVMEKEKSVPSDLFELIQNGVKHYANEELDLALKSFQKIAADHPFMAGSWHALGVMLSRLGKFAEAENALEKELKNQTSNPDTRQLLKDIRKMRQFSPLSKGKHYPAKVAGNPITIFTVPKHFGGNNDIIQRNAIRSWTLIEPRAEIILLGNEQGTSKVADEFGLKHMPDVKCNEYGTPILNSIIEIARSASKNDVMMYINTDIILSGEVMSAVKKTKQRFDKFLVIGQRWDVDIADPISYQITDIKMNLRKIAEHNGLLHSPSGIDYFIFRKNPWDDILPFAIGRTAWDGWLVFKALSLNVPVIDATESILAVHQNHDYSHAQGGYKGAWNGPEAILNQKLSGGYKSVRSVADANWSLIDGELARSQCDFPDLAKKQQSPHDFAQRLYQQSIYFLKEHKFERALTCIEEAQRNNGTIEGLSKILNLAKQGQKLSKLTRPQRTINCCET